MEVISNLNAPVRMHVRSHRSVAPDTSDLTIKSRQVDPGYIGVYDFISGYDETTANKRMKIQVVNGSETLTLADRTVGTSDRTLDIQQRIYVPEGGYIQAVIVSPEADDVCHLAYVGYWVRTL